VTTTAAATQPPEASFDLAGSTALVTGGSRGVGRMIAEAYVASGARVYIASRDMAACEATAAELSQAGDCLPMYADLATEAGCRTLAAHLAGRETGLQILVNNAGAAWGAPLQDFDDSAWQRVLAVNVQASFHMARFVLPLLRAGASADAPAHVINIGSVEGVRPGSFENYSYAASKAAVHHMTRQLARQLAPEVLVNCLVPGVFASRMTGGLLREHGESIRARIPLARTGGAGDIAGPAVFLASHASRYVTGTLLVVDGGYLLT
jgi:NAD(P)-dependent dehydrogenase (short-subunit alcohol dehydrogenase family)